MKQYATILECNHCNNFLYVISDATRYGDGTTSINLSKTKDYYPKNNPKVDGSVPEKVARDFLEALVCAEELSKIVLLKEGQKRES